MLNTVRIGPRCREIFLPSHEVEPALRGISLAGCSWLVEDYLVHREAPDFHLLLATRAGSGRLERPVGMGELHPGDLLLVPAGHAHHYRLFASDWHIVWCHLHPQHWRLPDQQPRRITGLDTDIERWAVAAEAAIASQQAGHHALRSAWCRVLNELWRQLLAPDDHTDPQARLLQDLLLQWDRQLALPWSLQDLCARSGYSPAHLQRLCREHWGIPPMAMLRELRLRRARQLLLGGTDTLSSIANQVGYENPFALSVAIKRRWGASPQALRQGCAGPNTSGSLTFESQPRSRAP